MSKFAKRRTTIQEGLFWQPTEEAEQEAVIEWAELMRNQVPELDLLFHIPNGGWRHPGTAVKMKKAGVKAGVPDLFLPVPRGLSHGLWIEMKRTKGGKVSDEQKDWIEALEHQGYVCIIAHGAEEACDAIWKYLSDAESEEKNA